MHSHAIGIVAIVLYLLAAGLLAVLLVRGRDAVVGGKFTPIVAGLAAVALHTVVLYPEMITGHGLNLGFFNAASLIGLFMALLLLLSALARPVENLGIVMLPVAALTIALMFAYPTRHIVRERPSWALDIHIALSVLAYSLLAMAAVQAAVLALQHRQLHNHQPGGLIRSLPPLQTMENLLFQMIGAGFVLLSLALISGFVFLEDIFAQHLVHKTVLSIVAWVVFAVLLWGRRRFGWRGRIAIRWTLGGFAVLMLSYFGTKIVLEFLLHR
ncbi:MAG TPA: cytochrome c biogenesis protein CcsA [Gammaproteobacteria bacterium]|nr:cytochrome c biogenesis protein CcsA [Gammaproteobacteria bacterium]